MDERNFSNIFRKATGNFFCPACGAKYQGTEIESIERHAEGYLVSVSCSSCNLKLSMQVVTKGFTSPYLTSHSVDETITVDEIIELHDELKRFDGNFRGVFDRRDCDNHMSN